MEAPYPPYTVAPFAVCCFNRRPVPVLGAGDGGFHLAPSGKYNVFAKPSRIDAPPVSSNCSAEACSDEDDNDNCFEDAVVSDNGYPPTPGRIVESTMETLELSDSVQPTAASVQHSRPGPAFRCSERVFQPVSPGKYHVNAEFSLFDVLSNSSHNGCSCSDPQPGSRNPPVNNTDLLSTTFGLLPIPRRNSLSIMEAPCPSDTVAPKAVNVNSRLGPVFGIGKGVFQSASPGKYPHVHEPYIPPSDVSSLFSRNGFNALLHDKLPCCSYGSDFPILRRSADRADPGRTDICSSSTDRAKPFHVYYQNVCGMNSSVEDYLHACSGDCYDIIALTETWLNDRTTSTQLFGSGYDVFRCDRGPMNSKKVIGGGVLIAVRRSFKARLIDNVAWSIVEQVWISIKLVDRTVYLCVVYFPPDRTRDEVLYKAHCHSVIAIAERARPSDEIVIVGDFNLPKLTWRVFRDGFLYPDPDRSQFHPCALKLLDCYSSATLQQINGNKNEDDRCLDLCFISTRNTAPSLTVAPAPLVKIVPRHPALVLSLDGCFSTEFRDTSSQINYNFKCADFESIVLALQSIDWVDVLDHNDIDAAVNVFTSILSDLIERFVPKVQKSVAEHLPWQTAELRRLKRSKRAAFKKHSKLRTLALREHYLRTKNEYKRLSRRCLANYQKRMQRKLKTDPKKFWKFVNEQRKESGLPTTMVLASDEAENTLDICRLFAKKFSSVFSNESLSSDQVQEAANNVRSPERSISSIEITETVIITAMAKLKNSTTPGPDGIPAILLKKCSSGLLAPLLHLFRLSVSTGRFPALWKQAYMFPVHKKGDRTNVDNYRGISALCATSKLFELIVIAPVFAHGRHILVDEQHGFFPKRSTTSNLLCFTGFVNESFVEHSQTDAIYTDLSAAFDKINHNIAVAKLGKLGFCGSLLSWFQSYLTGRSLRVKIGDELSDTFDATSGIAQGSHLGPLVFLFYFNDVNYSLEGPRISYADDMKIYTRIDNIVDALFQQQQLNNFAHWCEVNRMVLNPEKCLVVTFSRKLHPLTFDYQLGGFPIPRADYVKDLGVILDSKLTFKQHVSLITAKASRQLGLVIRMTKDFTSIPCLLALYCSLVRSSLEYCSAVWNPYYNNAVYRIESIQRRFVRYALRLLPWRQPLQLPPYENRCQLLHLDTLQLRRELARATLVSDVLTARIDCPELLGQMSLRAPARRLRSTATLHTPLRRTNYSANSAIIGLQKAFNRVFSVFDFNLSRSLLRSKFISMLRSVFYQ